jgi:hypothetical protein
VSSVPPDESAAPNPFRERLPVVLGAAVVFVVLLVVSAVTQENAVGTVVVVYGIVGGVLLGRLLVRTERARPAPDVDRAPGT